MPVHLWCEGIYLNDRCDIDHRGICHDDCDTPAHSFGGRRTLQARPGFDGAPPDRGPTRRLPDSMDAFKTAVDWQDNGPPETRLFPIDGRTNVYDMHACYNIATHEDFPDCPVEPRCEVGPFDGPWVTNCGSRVEGGSDMHGMYCSPVRRPLCPRPDEPVSFQADAFSGRTAFIGSVGAGAECNGIWNWICMGADERGRGCLSTDERRGWSPAIIDWTGARLVRPVRNRYSRPEIEHALQRTALRYVREHAGELGVSHLLRPDNDQMPKIDWWSATWNVLPPPMGCGELPSIATLPGAKLQQAGCDVSAELVLFSVHAWMSLHFRREDVFQIGGAEPRIAATTYPATVQLGLDIELAARATVVGECTTTIPTACGTPPKSSGGEPVVFFSEGWYRPPYRVRWRGEATPLGGGMIDLSEIVKASTSSSHISICRSLRAGIAGELIEPKSIAKGGGPIQFYDGVARIRSIGG